MIFINKNNVREDSFLSLLSNTKSHCLTELSSFGERTVKINGDEFETLVYNNSLKASVNTEFDGHVVQTGPHAFPDIIAKKYFGLEVKVTKDNKWSSTGNSILETTRVDDVERIYMFFGKLAGGVDIKYRPYQDCLYDIGVTHSPRYKIDMDLAEGHTIFDKMGVPYDVLRKEENPIARIKDYYRKQLQDGEELWWIDSQVEEKAVSPIIRPFRMLIRSEQEKFITETMILFPEIFGRSQTKYERPAAYLITDYNAVSSSLRDIFTAGGQVTITVNGVDVLVPKIFYNLLENAKTIQNIINGIPDEKLKYYWKTEQIKSSKVEQWKQILDYQTGAQFENMSASAIYEWGLK
ncbi:MAG TPA: hypothetical protein VMR41_02455 [Patescibacteria group bacterium]|nr:hypothetical protein [Patescibacteria group bacterium]